MEKNYTYGGNENNQAPQWTPNTPENGNNDSGEKKNRKKLIIVAIIAVVAIIAIIIAISFRKTAVPTVESSVSQTEESVSVAVPEATESATTATVEETATTVEAESEAESESESVVVEMLDFETFATQEGADSINLVVYNETSGMQKIIEPGSTYAIQPNDRFAVNLIDSAGDTVLSIKVNSDSINNFEGKSFIELDLVKSDSPQKVGVSFVTSTETKFVMYKFE